MNSPAARLLYTLQHFLLSCVVFKIVDELARSLVLDAVWPSAGVDRSS